MESFGTVEDEREGVVVVHFCKTNLHSMLTIATLEETQRHRPTVTAFPRRFNIT